MGKRHPNYRLVKINRNYTVDDVSRTLGVHKGTVRNWIKQDERDRGQRQDGLTSEERAELVRLRRENKQLKLEQEILAKAAAWFARETNSIPSKSSSS